MPVGSRLLLTAALQLAKQCGHPAFAGTASQLATAALLPCVSASTTPAPLLLVLKSQKDGMTAAAHPPHSVADSGFSDLVAAAATATAEAQQQQQSDQQQQLTQKQQHRWTPQQEHFMSLAFEQAHLALKVREVPIGCVVVRGDQVVGTGYNLTNHTRNATRHAEMEAIDRILADNGGDVAKADFGSCELYVTIEPCIMCAGALSLIGIKHVYYGAANDKFGGCGSILQVHQDGCGCCSGRPPGESQPAKPFTAVGGLFADEAIRLLQTFYTAGNPAAPKPHRAVMEVPPWEQTVAGSGACLQQQQQPRQQEPQQQQLQQERQQQQQQQQQEPQQKQQQPQAQQQESQQQQAQREQQLLQQKPVVGWQSGGNGQGQVQDNDSRLLLQHYAP